MMLGHNFVQRRSGIADSSLKECAKLQAVPLVHSPL